MNRTRAALALALALLALPSCSKTAPAPDAIVKPPDAALDRLAREATAAERGVDQKVSTDVGPLATSFTPETQKQAVAAFKAKMEAEGYEVRDGGIAFFRIEDCKQMTSCFGNNPTSPYGELAMPALPGEAVPYSEYKPFPDKNVIWRMREDEAVVYFGPTPPKARYYSFVPYVFGRTDPLPKILFASLSDALNFKTIKLGSPPATDAYGPHTVVITTADKNADKAIRTALAASGISQSLMNTMGLPRALLKMGIDAKADSFMSLHRIALFEDKAKGDAYLNAPPAAVLRITPKTAKTIDPMAVVPLSPRGSGTNEDALKPALNLLELAIRAKHASGGLTSVETEIALNGHECIKEGKDCLGDINDTAYSTVLNINLLPKSPDDFFVIFGVNHEASGKALYSNFGVVYLAKLAGVGSISSDKMKGSADFYLPNHPDRDKLYAFRIRRDCTGDSFCLEVPTEFPGVPLISPPAFQYRAYLEPGKVVAPSFAELLPGRLIKFSK